MQLDDVLQLLVPFQQSFAEFRRQLKIYAERKSHFYIQTLFFILNQKIFSTHTTDIRFIRKISIREENCNSKQIDDKICVPKNFMVHLARFGSSYRFMSMNLLRNTKEMSNVNGIKIDLAWLRMTMKRDSCRLLLPERTLRFALPHSDTDPRAKDLRSEQATAVTVYSFSLRNDPRSSQMRQVGIESWWDAQSQNRRRYLQIRLIYTRK